VVIVGQHGLTSAVLHEIDVNLRAHELIKVRVFNDDRDQREVMLARICAELDAVPVQHIGKLFVLWRPAPDEAPKAVALGDTRAKAKGRRIQRQTAAKATTMARSTPQARRPRTPLARTARRPPMTRTTKIAPKPAGGTRRRRRDTF
jgi:RNA-binding protein